MLSSLFYTARTSSSPKFLCKFLVLHSFLVTQLHKQINCRQSTRQTTLSQLTVTLLGDSLSLCFALGPFKGSLIWSAVLYVRSYRYQGRCFSCLSFSGPRTTAFVALLLSLVSPTCSVFCALPPRRRFNCYSTQLVILSNRFV